MANLPNHEVTIEEVMASFPSTEIPLNFEDAEYDRPLTNESLMAAWGKIFKEVPDEHTEADYNILLHRTIPTLWHFKNKTRLQILFAIACLKSSRFYKEFDAEELGWLEAYEKYGDGGTSPDKQREIWIRQNRIIWDDADDEPNYRRINSRYQALSALNLVYSGTPYVTLRYQINSSIEEIDRCGGILIAFSQPEWNWNKNWNTNAVIDMADKVYLDGAWELCPILADALEEAGGDQRIVDELRTRTMWFRGDWIIDKARKWR